MITESTMKRGVCDAARRANISKCYMSQIANGKRKPSKTLAKKLKRMGIRIPKASATN